VGQLADQQLVIGVHRHAVAACALACTLDPPAKIYQSGDEGDVLSLVVRGDAGQVAQADNLPLARPGLEQVRGISVGLLGTILKTPAITVHAILRLRHVTPPDRMGFDGHGPSCTSTR
jgi:hypothetical protein